MINYLSGDKVYDCVLFEKVERRPVTSFNRENYSHFDMVSDSFFSISPYKHRKKNLNIHKLLNFLKPELASRRAEHSLPYSDVTIYIFDT